MTARRSVLALFLLGLTAASAQAQVGFLYRPGGFGSNLFGYPNYGFGGYPGAYGGYPGGYGGYPGGFGGYPGYGGYPGAFGSPYYSVPSYTTTYYTFPAPRTADRLLPADPPPRARASLYPAIPYRNAPGGEQDLRAHLDIVVPGADAELTMNGVATAQRGTQRTFMTPPLTPGTDYSYELGVRWTTPEGPQSRRKTVDVRAGGQYRVDFTEGLGPTP